MAGLRRSPETYFEVVEDKAVIVDPEGRELLTLNRTATIVWHALDGERDEDQIIDQLAARFPEVPRDQLLADVRRFVAELTSVGLLVEH
jgi:hypothetical protein